MLRHKFNNPGLVYYKALSKYLELAQEIPEVEEVRLSDDDLLYTIISSPWAVADEVSYRVYDAEAQAIMAMRGYPFDFRLLNDQAPGIENRAAHNRRHGKLVWARDATTERPAEGIVKAHKLNNPGWLYYLALSKYLELVQEIPEVVEVRLSGDDELYAILSATPHEDAPRYRVYRAEGEVMDSVNGQPYRFRLVNTQELPEEGREEHICSFGDLVWKK